MSLCSILRRFRNTVSFVFPVKEQLDLGRELMLRYMDGMRPTAAASFLAHDAKLRAHLDLRTRSKGSP